MASSRCSSVLLVRRIIFLSQKLNLMLIYFVRNNWKCCCHSATDTTPNKILLFQPASCCSSNFWHSLHHNNDDRVFENSPTWYFGDRYLHQDIPHLSLSPESYLHDRIHLYNCWSHSWWLGNTVDSCLTVSVTKNLWVWRKIWS